MPLRPHMARACRLMAVAALGVVAALAASPAHAEESDLARAVKATFVYKFAAFVDWPPDVVGPEGAPFRICVSGDDAFGRLIARAAAGQRVHGRPIAVALVQMDAARLGCRILFAGPYGPVAVSAVLAAERGRPVLTVTDEATSGDAKGIVHFVIRGGRVRFEIDRGLAEAGGLSISPKVLELAVEVRQ